MSVIVCLFFAIHSRQSSNTPNGRYSDTSLLSSFWGNKHTHNIMYITVAVSTLFVPSSFSRLHISLYRYTMSKWMRMFYRHSVAPAHSLYLTALHACNSGRVCLYTSELYSASIVTFLLTGLWSAARRTSRDMENNRDQLCVCVWWW